MGPPFSLVLCLGGALAGRHSSNTWGPEACSSLQPSDDTVWRLLLQHAWQPLEQGIVCRLMCCSPAMLALVHSCCQHRLPIKLTQQQQQQPLTKQLNSWLTKHQGLVCELVCSPAAAGPTVQQQLLVRLPKLLPAAPAVPPLPTVLTGTDLTRLEWALTSSSKAGRAAVRTIRQLQGLRSLALTCIDTGGASGSAGSFEFLAPAVAALSRLTVLTLQHFALSAAASRALPASLQLLILGPPLPRVHSRSAQEQQQLHLQHLTSLQHLALHSLRGCDLLPAGLLSLKVHHCSVLPLLSLTQLQRLHISCDPPEAVLAQLCRMSSLQQLQLTFRTWTLSPSGLQNLQQLPLCSLQCALSSGQLAVLGQLGARGKLVDLHVQVQLGEQQQGSNSCWRVQLAQQLQQLTTLETLCSAAAAAGWVAA